MLLGTNLVLGKSDISLSCDAWGTLSFAVAGAWIPRWLAQVRAHQVYAQNVRPVEVLYQYRPVSAFACLILIGLMLKVTRWDHDMTFATACVLDLVLIPQTLSYSLTVLLLPILLIVIQRCAIWAPLIAIASWGILWFPYRIQMTAVPLAVWGLILVGQRGLECQEARMSCL